MTWTVVTKNTRPNTGVDWYSNAGSGFGPMSDSDTDYIKNNYVDNGKRVSADRTVSGEGLVRCNTLVFRDKAAYDEYEADSIVTSFRNAQITYNRSNNIVLTSRTSSAT